MQEQSSIRVNSSSLAYINRWCEKLGCSQAELIDRWIDEVKLKNQRKFYESLPAHPAERKPLKGKRLKVSAYKQKVHY